MMHWSKTKVCLCFLELGLLAVMVCRRCRREYFALMVFLAPSMGCPFIVDLPTISP